MHNSARFNRKCRDCGKRAEVARRELIHAAPARCTACGGILDLVAHAPQPSARVKRAVCHGCDRRFERTAENQGDFVNGLACPYCGGVVKIIWSYKPPRGLNRSRNRKQRARRRKRQAATACPQPQTANQG